MQLELMRCIQTNVDFMHVHFWNRRIQCNFAHRTHIRKFRTQTTSVTVISERQCGTLIIYSSLRFDSLGRFATTSQCMACIINNIFA